jgi:hypothetical protein
MSRIATFATLLSTLNNGDLEHEITAAMRDIVAEMHESPRGKAKGKITVTIDFAYDGDIFSIAGDFKAVKPKKHRPASVFWATPENNLSRQDPRQPDLPLRDISVPATRTINA